MARLIPAEKGTHYVLLSLAALLLLPLGGAVAAGVCAALAIGREVYGRWRRFRTMTRADWREALLDIGAGLAGCAVVLAAAQIGLQ
jgi:hypothetical protein